MSCARIGSDPPATGTACRPAAPTSRKVRCTDTSEGRAASRRSRTSSAPIRRSTRSSRPSSGGSRRRPSSSASRPARRSSPRAPGRSITCGSSAAARWRSSSTAACLTCSAPASCSGTPRCSPDLPTGFAARADEDAVCYRIPADGGSAHCSARPAGLRYVARSLLEMVERPAAPSRRSTPPQRPVAELLRSPLVLCSPGDVDPRGRAADDRRRRDVGRRRPAATAARSGS